MSNYLNPGNELFRKYIRKKTYVDKTGFIGAVNRYMVEENNCICVARPRRFGKSYAADMLAAYYDRGCDSSDIFKDFKIAQDPTFEEYLNKYDVFQIDMTGVINMTTDAETGLKDLSEGLIDDLREAYPDIVFKNNNVPSMLDAVHQKTGTMFVFIIDEWDCPMRERKDDKDSQKLYLQFLRGLLKDKKYLLLAYMTGILPMKMNGTQSEANMFDEFTMLDCSPMQEYFGFTEDEVKALCEERGRSFDEMREWYDGYDVEGISIYNPRSVSRSLSSGKPGNYWTHTETYEALEIYINNNKYGVQDVLVQLLAGKEVEVSTGKFANDMTTFKGRDDVLTLLIHLGYLTYDRRTKKARIPNREIREEFVDVTENAGLGNFDRARLDSEKVFEATMRGDENKVAEYVRKIHRMRSSKLEYNKEISLKFAIEFAYLAAEDRYSLVLEMPAGDGFADVGYIPLDCNDPTYPPMIVELKIDECSGGAIGQAMKNEYHNFLSAYHGEVILVGINYSTKTKEHTCEIRRVVKE